VYLTADSICKGLFTSASYLDILLNIDLNGTLKPTLYDKRDDVYFVIVNLPFLCSNILLSSAYGMFILQLIRYARACFAYVMPTTD
jgi:hypothetical protein